MAFTVTRYKTVFGNKKAVGMDITADAATQTIETGLSRVEWVATTIGSMSSANFKTAINSNASGVQSFGVVAVTGVASGDRLFITAYGV
jgi:hypothetical protein